VIADLGAGTGNYARALAVRGYRVKAVEPSAVMRVQATAHLGVQFLAGTAEAIPLPDGSVDGVINLLSFHHYADRWQAVREMGRVVGDGLVLFLTFDYHRLEEPFWLADYFPEIFEAARSLFPPVREVAARIAEIMDRQVDIEPFPLPYDLEDLFMAACWRQPERYLDPAVRAGISGFVLADPSEFKNGLDRLQDDLNSGRWREQYGAVLAKETLDAGIGFDSSAGCSLREL